MPDALLIAAIVGTFLLAGLVKGVIGFGLPIVSLALLTLAIDLPSAIALMLVPSLATNVWQATVGGHGMEILRRTWPFLLMVAATVWLGVLVLTQVNLALMSALLGLLLIAYSALNLSGWAVTVNGRLAGMTGVFVMPGVLYLQALGLGRDALVQAMGILFVVATLALAVSLGGNDLLSAELGLLSLAALVPAVVGMAIGQHIRRRLPEPLFRHIFFSSMIILGVFIIVSAANGAGAT